MHKVKVVATLGPSSSEESVISAMCQYIDGFRINFSHGDERVWSDLVLKVRRASQMPIIGDLRGPRVRVAEIRGEIRFNPGSTLVFKYDSKSDGTYVPIPDREFFDILDVGDEVLLDDGRIRLIVERAERSEAKLIAVTKGSICKGRGVVVKGKDYATPIPTQYDRIALRFAVENDIDYVGISYVRSAIDVENVRRELRSLGKDIRIVSKIETTSSLKSLNEIIECSDYVMIARGDLGMNLGLEEIPRVQRQIVEKCLEHGVPVMIATQLLESIMSSPVQTRAEVIDVVNAIIEGVDALVLTGETAVGMYPVEAVRWTRRIASIYERDVAIDENKVFSRRLTEQERLARGIVRLAESIGAKILVFTRTGNATRKLAMHRPRMGVYVGASDPKISRQLKLLWGIESAYVQARDYEEGLEESLKYFIERGDIVRGDVVLMTCRLSSEEHIIRVVKV